MPRTKSLGWLLTAMLLLAVVLVAGNWQLVTGKSVPIWDASTFYSPAYILVADSARSGHLLLWDPFMNGGRPDCADAQVGAFSPMTVGLGVLTGGSLRGFNLYWLLNWWLAGVGVLLLTRHLGAPLWGCTVAALAFMASGALTGHAQHTSFVHSFAAVPFILWRLDKALAKNRKLPAAQAGAIWGLSALAGYPALTILSLFFAGFWTLGRLLTSRAAGDGLSSAGKGTPAALLNVLQSWVILLVVGLVSLAPTYWAFFVEGNGYSDRVGPLSREVAVASNALDPSALATFSTPQLNVTKSRHRDKLWPYTPISQVSVYFVATALTLAAYSLTDRRNRRWKLFLLVVAILFLASAMGRALPVRGWLYDLLPPFGTFGTLQSFAFTPFSASQYWLATAAGI